MWLPEQNIALLIGQRQLYKKVTKVIQCNPEATLETTRWSNFVEKTITKTHEPAHTFRYVWSLVLKLHSRYF